MTCALPACRIAIHACDSVLIRNCTSAMNRSPKGKDAAGGFLVDFASNNTVIEYCAAYSNRGPGYLVQATKAGQTTSNVTLRYSTSLGDGNSTSYGSVVVYAATGARLSNIVAYGNLITVNDINAPCFNWDSSWSTHAGWSLFGDQNSAW